MTSVAVKESVLRLYMAYPYPQWTREERHWRLAGELCRYRFLGLAEFMHGARFLDVGCGTGNRSMLAAKHFGVKEFVGMDHSTASLEIAKRVAEEEGFERFTPVEGNLFNIPYPDESFDIVVSWGVLHHTDDPLRGLREMVRVCRPNGFVGIFVYNKWNHWRHNIQKNKVSKLAGPDIEERFAVAHRLYGTKPIEEMDPGEISAFCDKYCHPYKSDHTLRETLSWFDQLRLTYWGSYPPLRMRDALSCLQYRGTLLSEYPLANQLSGRAVTMAMKFPSFRKTIPPFQRPGLLHCFLWQAIFAWMGRHGEYSGGAALSARKPLSS